MDVNLLNSTTTERISKFYNNVVDFLVCLPDILTRLRRMKYKMNKKRRKNSKRNRKNQKCQETVTTPFHPQSHGDQALDCLDISQQPCCKQIHVNNSHATRKLQKRVILIGESKIINQQIIFLSIRALMYDPDEKKCDTNVDLVIHKT